MKTKLDVNYYKNPTGKKRQLSHKLTEEWTVKDQIHCPNCGHKGIWISDRNNCEVGPEHICLECGYSFHLPYSGVIVSGVSLQRLELLRAEEMISSNQDDMTLAAVCTSGPEPDYKKDHGNTSSQVIKSAKALCIKFTDKVESGRARSCETYAECKALLKMISSAEAEDAPKSSTRELVFKAGANDNPHQGPDTLRMILNKSTASEIVDTLKPIIEAKFGSEVNFRLMIAGTWIGPTKV